MDNLSPVQSPPRNRKTGVLPSGHTSLQPLRPPPWPPLPKQQLKPALPTITPKTRVMPPLRLVTVHPSRNGRRSDFLRARGRRRLRPVPRCRINLISSRPSPKYQICIDNPVPILIPAYWRTSRVHSLLAITIYLQNTNITSISRCHRTRTLGIRHKVSQVITRPSSITTLDRPRVSIMGVT